jgi:hypothetical protein
LDDVVLFYSASSISQKLKAFLVRHSNADGFQDLQTGPMDLFDLLLCQKPVARHTLSFEATVHDIHLLAFEF